MTRYYKTYFVFGRKVLDLKTGEMIVKLDFKGIIVWNLCFGFAKIEYSAEERMR